MCALQHRASASGNSYNLAHITTILNVHLCVCACVRAYVFADNLNKLPKSLHGAFLCMESLRVEEGCVYGQDLKPISI